MQSETVCETFLFFSTVKSKYYCFLVMGVFECKPFSRQGRTHSGIHSTMKNEPRNVKCTSAKATTVAAQ